MDRCCHRHPVKLRLFWPCLVVAILLMAIGVPRQLRAQEKSSAVQASTSAQEADSSAARIFLQNVEIQGRIEKPQTVFILPGKDPDVDAIQIDRSFFKEIFRKVEKDDLTRLRRKH